METNREFELKMSVYIPLFCIMFIPFLLPYYINQMDSLETFRYFAKWISLFVMLVFAFKHYYQIRKEIFFIIGIYLLFLISTFLNGTGISSALNNTIQIILICITVGIIIEDSYMCWDFLNVVKWFCLICWIVNLICVIIYPSGIPNISTSSVSRWVFGNVNSSIKFIYPGIMCSCILDHKKGRISAATLIYFGGMIYIFFAIYHSATTLVTLIFLIAWLALRNVIAPNLRRTLLIILGVIVIMEISMIILSNTSISSFVTQLFGKDSDFSGRVPLWQTTMLQISQKPLWGYGSRTTAEILEEIGNSSGSHNYYLDYIYQHGVIGFVSLLILILQPFFSAKRGRYIGESAYIVVGFCCGYLIMFIMEPFNGWDNYYVPIFYAARLLMRKNLDDETDVLESSY